MIYLCFTNFLLLFFVLIKVAESQTISRCNIELNTDTCKKKNAFIQRQKITCTKLTQRDRPELECRQIDESKIHKSLIPPIVHSQSVQFRQYGICLVYYFFKGISNKKYSKVAYHP